ncbi:MAG: ribonuclease D [Halioglobus sp.]|nr:ribonuclease D [Halioglobus sp.]MBP6724852.1 ribonuclease D [Halioglobus sp.]
MQWQLIESDAALQAALAQAQGRTVVAVDTEFMRRNTFYPQVALVQLCFGDTALLVDPLAIKNTAPLAALLTDPGVVKVLHSASEDLEVFSRWLGVLPQPLFDTQRAAALLNLGFGMGYSALVKLVCDIELPKGETTSDWLRRPLTTSQCEYAAQDVAWLLPVWRHLEQLCLQQGKESWVLSDGRDAIAAYNSPGNDYFKRFKNAWKLDSRQLATLRAVCEWRELAARSRDKPRGWIIDDPACVQLAQFDPKTADELRSQVGLDAAAMRRNAAELLELLAAQRKVPAEQLPARLPGPLDATQRKQLKLLKARVQGIAAQLSTAPEALLQSRDYELLLREAGGEAVEPPLHWQGWRSELVIEPLRASLAGT